MNVAFVTLWFQKELQHIKLFDKLTIFNSDLEVISNRNGGSKLL